VKEVQKNQLVDAHAMLRSVPTTFITPGAHYLSSVTELFRDYFSGLGYAVEPAVRITAKLDPTVRFIGAPISVLKPYFMRRNLHPVGHVMVQNCIRTRNVKTLHDMDGIPKYGSFFTGMCVLVSYDRLPELCREAVKLLYEQLGLNEGEICINVSKRDKDLIKAIDGLLPAKLVNIDTKPPGYYIHRYGIEGVGGRNLNLAIKNARSGEYEDIGNIIVIETDTEKLGVELALGDTTIVQQLLGLDHVQDNYNLGLPATDPIIKRKMEDAIMTSLVLYSEGLRPTNASSTQSRILRSYVKTISLTRLLCRMDLDELEALIESVENTELPFVARGYAREIREWIEDYEDRLSIESINLEDAKIAKIIEAAHRGE
jgi:hypothetical protein